MKNQNAQNKLAFKKAVITELNDNQLHEVNGGTFISLIIPISISIYTIIK